MSEKKPQKRNIPASPLNQDEPDLAVDVTLRPNHWGEYVGQEKIKDNVRLIIEAAKQRKESCDHLLFYGQAGLGKTSLAYLIGKEMGVSVRTTSGPALEKSGDIAAILSNIEPNEILFVDEAHRINKLAEEVFYPALESRKLHLVVGKGPSARTLSLDLPPFTVIAATTKVNLISSPLRSRFGGVFHLDYYKHEDIQKIVRRSANILGANIHDKAIVLLAAASRYTPRVANRLLRRARDYAQVHNNNVIDENSVLETLKMLEIDALGLEQTDRRLLETVIKKFNGGPVGIKSIATALNEDVGTVEEVIEPFLVTTGLLNRTSLGRVITPLAYKHLGISQDKNLI